MEHKQTEATITAVDEAQGIVEAIWAVMGNTDEVGDIIHPGAFTKTFSERGNQIKLLDNHRTDSVMASLGLVKELREVKRTELPQSMMDSHPDVTGGAWGRFQFLLDTPEGLGAFKRIKSGSVTQWSFGYDAVDKDYSQKDGKMIRNLRGLKLYEVSPVLFPANTATTTTDAKAKPDYEDEEDKATWSAAYINDLPDSSFLLVESGGEKDGDGKTTPRSLRHLPYKDAEGNVDLPHLRNAISRLGQTDTGTTGGESWLSEDVRKRLLSRAKRLLEQNQKSVDFVTILTQERIEQNLWEERWKLNNAIGEVIDKTLRDEQMDDAAKRELVTTSLTQFNRALLQWFDRALSARLMTEEIYKSLKAGRVLSARNAKRIKAAMDELHSCLMEAGLMEMPEEDANTGPQKSDTDTPTPKAQGAGPNEDDSTRLLKLIDLELEETEV